MKKFLKIRNILILLIIIVAIFFICWGRSDNVQNSKSYQLFKHFYEYGPEYGNTENNTIMRLENIGEEEIALTYATDYDNKREITSIEKLSQTSKDTMQTVQIINIISNEGRNTYFLFEKDKQCLKFDTMKEEATDLYASWAEDIMNSIQNNKYYTKGYNWIDGNFMYYEYFKETGMKFYFNNNGELKYLSSKTLDNSFSSKPEENAYLFKVTISHDSIDETLIEIPQDYEIKDSEQNIID